MCKPDSHPADTNLRSHAYPADAHLTPNAYAADVDTTAHAHSVDTNLMPHSHPADVPVLQETPMYNLNNPTLLLHCHLVIGWQAESSPEDISSDIHRTP